MITVALSGKAVNLTCTTRTQSVHITELASRRHEISDPIIFGVPRNVAYARRRRAGVQGGVISPNTRVPI